MEIETIDCTIREVKYQHTSEVEIVPHSEVYSPRLGEDIYCLSIDSAFGWARLEQLFTNEELIQIILKNETITKSFNVKDLVN